ncbi:MAG: exo-alpha-sialidase [Saprospiraceae bacterium]|nr:exo-alpha-sialidase [Saprospiraceae bacterium]
MRNHHLAFMFLVLSLAACQQVEEKALASFTATPAATTSPGGTKTGAANIVFQSTDRGKTWADISDGLPIGTKPFLFFAGKDELILGDDKGNYTTKTAPMTANWEKELAMDQQLLSVWHNPSGAIAINNSGQFFQQQQDMGLWMPVFTNFKSALGRSVFTAKDGSIFIGTDNGIFKSADQGKTWKHVMQDGWAFSIVESDGVLLCNNLGGILRSTDGGETWAVVLYEGGVGIDVEVINGGFAAITYNTETESRRIRTSTDGGKTWHAIDAGLPPSKLITSIQQVGDYFYCGHPDGIYRCAVGGNSWELLLPTIGEKVFNLSVSEGVMYAVLREGGC